MVKFQHNQNITVTKKNYCAVYEYKKELLYQIMRLFNNLRIKCFICYGNLIEYERKDHILHDDDIDIIFDGSKFREWCGYAAFRNKKLYDYNLEFDNRWYKPEEQMKNGIQVSLINFVSKEKDLEKIISKMDMHADIIPDFIDSKVWPNIHVNLKNLRRIKLWGINTYAPSIKDTIRILENEYGKDYIKPIIKNYNLTDNSVYYDFIKLNSVLEFFGVI
jgi:hypothetical protein